MTEEIDASNNTGEIARNSLMSRMGTPHREIVLPNIRPRWGKYKASEVEQAFREIAVQVDDLQSTVTQEVVQMLSTIITEVHRETTSQRQVAEAEISEMREEIKREGALIISNAQREALTLDHKMDEIRRLAAEVANAANSTSPA